MKKIILFLFLLLIPAFASATIDQNLYYGLYHNDEVKELQQYLISKGFMTGNATGNFFSLTFNAVQKYQASQNIHATGYVGPMTRQAINSDNSSGSTGGTFAPLTGSLDLSPSASYSSQSVISPQSKFKLADFSLKNNTDETVNVQNIEADLSVSSNLYVANMYVTNLYITYGNGKTTVLNTISYKNNWAVNFQIPVGQSTDISLYGDVNSSIPLNSVINSSILVTGVTAVSNTPVNTNSDAVMSGQSITFGTSALTVGEDGSTPASTMVAYNQRVIAGKFQFASAGDSYTISELKFIVPGSTTGSVIQDAILADASTQALLVQKPVPVAYDGTNYVLDFKITTAVPINSSKSLTIYYDLGLNINSSTSDTNIAPVLAYVKATNSEGSLLDGAASNYSNIFLAYNGISLPSDGVTVNSLYVFKTLPTFSADSSATSASNGSDINLYTLKIAADPKGDVSVKQLTFIITINDPNFSNPNLNNFTFFKGDANYTGLVSIENIINNNYIGLTSTNGVGVGLTNNVIVTFAEEEKIPAGKTQAYSLKAYANNFIASTSGSSSISTYVPSDNTVLPGSNYLKTISKNIYYGLSQVYTDDSATPYNILWSDRSQAFPDPHNDFNGSYTKDWYNGYEVLNLPLPAQTVTAQ